jgi:integrase
MNSSGDLHSQRFAVIPIALLPISSHAKRRNAIARMGVQRYFNANGSVAGGMKRAANGDVRNHAESEGKADGNLQARSHLLVQLRVQRQAHPESTKQGNPRVARQMEAAHRTSLAKGEVGIREKKSAPTLAEFARTQFLPWAEVTFTAKSKTWLFYRNGVRRLLDSLSLASSKLDAISGEQIAVYVAGRQADKMQISSINRELQVLRRLLRLAVEWGTVVTVPKVTLLRGERHRERVVTAREEATYLTVAPEPLASIAALLVDSGMRPEECFRLRWEAITWTNGRRGAVLVTHGKTPAARRMLPMTPRVRAILENRWVAAHKPEEGWVWAAPTRSGHVEPSTIRKQHAKTFKALAEQAKNADEKAVRPFVLYDLRHTFLTRLGESGCNVWTLARIAGHSSITMSARYVHPSEDAVLKAMSGMNKAQTNFPGARPARLPS